MSNQLTLFAGDFLVRTSPKSQPDGRVPASAAAGPACGLTTPDWSAIYDRDTSLWRTPGHSGTPVEDWAVFSGTWPASGTMRSGACSPRPPLGRLTSEPAFGWLPTPTATANQTAPSMQKHPSCRAFVALFGAGPIHPEVYEWMMGFPPGWTDLEDSETP